MRDELITSVVLSPFWGIDMSLRFLPFLAATDASDEFGIGACTVDVDIDYVRELARKAERSGTYVTLEGTEPKPRARPLGTPISVAKQVSEFTAIFSVQRTDTEHINLREA